MKITREIILNGVAVMMALMFFYAAYSKLIVYDKSKQEMMNQIFPFYMAKVLVWLIPVLELIIVTGLLVSASRLAAFWASALLLTVFSLYIALTMTGIFGRIPCSCGGILKNMGYGTHLFFNLFFIVLAILGIALEKQWKPINRLFHFLKRKEACQN